MRKFKPKRYKWDGRVNETVNILALLYFFKYIFLFYIIFKYTIVLSSDI